MRNKVVEFFATAIVFFLQRYSWNDSLVIEIQQAVGIKLASGEAVNEFPTVPEHVEETTPAAQPETTVTAEGTTSTETTPPVEGETTTPEGDEQQPTSPEVTPAQENHVNETTPPVVEQTPAEQPAEPLTLEAVWKVVQEMQTQLAAIHKLVNI